MNKLEIGLIGNPNTGKTSLFNSLTGTYNYVGNWSGVTVEKKVGTLKEINGNLIDLPGVYSLNPLTKDEQVATNYFLNENFDSVINIIDASQLERNLHLTLQIAEYGKPFMIGLNMIDVALRSGMKIDVEKLSNKLQVPIIPLVARTGKGITDLLSILKKNEVRNPNTKLVSFDDEIEQIITDIMTLLPENLPGNVRWYAVQILEENEPVLNFVNGLVPISTFEQHINLSNTFVKENSSAKSFKQYAYQTRRREILQLITDCVIKENSSNISLSTKIDKIVTHKFLGIPIFLLLMFIMFKFTFDWIGTPLSDTLDSFISGPVTNFATDLLQAIGASDFIKSVILNGIIAGVGGVLVFVPQIFILFFFISLLEDSGYMARVATVMDVLMEKVGLNGKAFIPMIIGLGCNVPGIMAARTIEQPRERLLTILLTPLMSCSARLSVYSLFVAAFFKENQAIVVFSLYLLGIITALLLAVIFSKTILKKEQSYFIMELPPYRKPQWISLFRSTWDKGKGFVKKAGTFIFGGSVAIWFLSYAGPGGLNVPLDHSYLAKIGGFIAPIFEPIGFGTWQAGASLITGFLAKEVVVSTMNIIYHAPNMASLTHVISGTFTPLSAYSFLVFILLYIPCLATVAVIKKESGSTKWTIFSMFYSFIIAYILSALIYGIGTLLGY